MPNSVSTYNSFRSSCDDNSANQSLFRIPRPQCGSATPGVAFPGGANGLGCLTIGSCGRDKRWEHLPHECGRRTMSLCQFSREAPVHPRINLPLGEGCRWERKTLDPLVEGLPLPVASLSYGRRANTSSCAGSHGVEFMEIRQNTPGADFMRACSAIDASQSSRTKLAAAWSRQSLQKTASPE